MRSSQGGGFAARKASRAWSPKLQRRMSEKPVVEEFKRQRIGEAKGDEAGTLSIFCLTPFCSFYHETLNYTGRPWIKFRDFLLKLGKAKPHNRTFKVSGSRQTRCLDSI